ncbi:sensor histidine kinase [Microbacterium foliorum]|uniref:sensor histidine kinase n=1 Tax=Rothia terrae TaxID=396015 RepID=UPI0034438F17
MTKNFRAQDASAAQISPSTTGQSVLQTLRVSLHVMFALLLCTGMVIAVREDSLSTFAKVGAVHGALTLGVIYMLGTVLENRYARKVSRGIPAKNPRVFAPLWLCVVVILWAVLMYMSAGFTWLVFPIMFLMLYLLPVFPALLAVALLTAFSILFPLYRPNSALATELNPGMVIGPVMGALLSVIISFAYSALHKDAQHHARVAEQLRAVQAELIQKEHEAGRTEERERLAREIHDTLAQGLSSIVLMSRASAQALAHGKVDETARSLELIETSASENLAEARRFIHDLSSPALDSALVPALRRLCADTQAQETAKGTPLTCLLRIDGTDGEHSRAEHLPDQIQEALLRVAQGALANVAAHASARTAAVTVGLWQDAVTLDIFDDGVGFIPDATRSASPGGHTGYGLTSLRARVDAVGGTLSVESAPGNGTVLSAHIPLVDRS